MGSVEPALAVLLLRLPPTCSIEASLKLLTQLLDLSFGSKLSTHQDTGDGGSLVQPDLRLDGFFHAGKADQGQLGLILGVAYTHCPVLTANSSEGIRADL